MKMVLSAFMIMLPPFSSATPMTRNFTAPADTTLPIAFAHLSLNRRLFKDKWANAIGKVVSAGAVKFRVIGVAEEKGGSMIMNADNTIFMPLATARNIYGGEASYVVTVNVHHIGQKPLATDE